MKEMERVKHKILIADEYKFIWSGEYTPIIVSLGGSWAYGTNTETSDIDVRGIIHEPKEAILGLSNFEQLEKHDKEKDIDCVLYGLKKMCNLLLGNNPNCIEILSPQERNIVYASDIGKELIENRHLFLSKRAAFTFGSYAKSQLARLENAVCHDRLPQAKQEEHMLNSIQGMFNHFNERFANFDEGSVVLYTDEAVNKDYDKEVFLDVNLKHYPLRDYKGMWSEMQNVVKDYAKLNNRNRKKDIPHLCKHMMHLVRLYLMGIDILEKQEIITYREDDLDLLMRIRNGAYMNQDGTVKDSFYKLVEGIDTRFKSAVSNTKLPEKPNFNEVEKWIMSVYKRYLV